METVRTYVSEKDHSKGANEGYPKVSRPQAEEIAATDAVESLWKKARKTKSLQAVFNCLIEMSGKRQRCMYCDDSRGTTIEHYWPKSVYWSKCFLWENMLLLCQGCQCHKGNRFDLDSRGQPLLINPVDDDPWDFLFFETTTGILVARYEPTIGAPNPRELIPHTRECSH